MIFIQPQDAEKHCKNIHISFAGCLVYHKNENKFIACLCTAWTKNSDTTVCQLGIIFPLLSLQEKFHNRDQQPLKLSLSKVIVSSHTCYLICWAEVHLCYFMYLSDFYSALLGNMILGGLQINSYNQRKHIV